MEIKVATEDELSESVCLRLIADHAPSLVASTTMFRRGGNGYLRSNITKFVQIARHSPLLLLTDLDQAMCAAQVIHGWLHHPCPDGLLFRVAVREVESWLLADHDGIRTLLGPNTGSLPHDPDRLPDAKAELLRLARRSTRDVRIDLLPREGERASQGLGYNKRLCRFVAETWNPDAAAGRSNSLRRARMRLAALAATA